jgi:hypothetical protein
MTHCGHEDRHRTGPGGPGHAAEDFARRVARDAQRFGERIAEHAGAFARELRREWRHAQRGDAGPIADDVRGMLREVRGLVADVIDGVDDLLVRTFHPDAPEPWARVVTSREVECGGCGRPIGAGEECHLQRRTGGRTFRCAACGPPSDVPPPE